MRIKEISRTLDTMHDVQKVLIKVSGGVQNKVGSSRKYIVRRLTPLECCRLQGFPDDYCKGVEISDTSQYKMWGNGWTLPVALYVLQGINIELKKEVEVNEAGNND